MASYRFHKLHGLGNDFILIDARQHSFALSPRQIAFWSNRHTGIGCDQWLIIEAARNETAYASYRVFNADGSSAEQCLNGLRCIAWHLFRQGAPHTFQLESPGGPVQLWVAATAKARIGQVRVALAAPALGAAAVAWHGALREDVLCIPVADTQLHASAVSMGNPHAVVFVDDALAARTRYGQALSTHIGFAAGVNAGFAQISDADHLTLAVHERGSGPTLACGSGACAAAVAALAQKRVRSPVHVTQPGGTVMVDWQGPQHPVYMNGPAEFVFSGEFSDDPNG